MKKQQIRLIHIISILYFAATSVLHAAPKYEVIDLGEGLYPSCFNEAGQVVLENTAGYGETRNLYLWENGVTNQIYSTNDFLGGTYMNDSGTIAVRLTKFDGPDAQQYSILINGSQIETISAFTWDINNAGQMIQISDHPISNNSQTYLRNPDGSLLDCGNTESTFTTGVSVNNLGQVTGGTGSDTENFLGFVWDPVSGKRYLSPLNGNMKACGMDINLNGQVVGYSATSMEREPFNWDWNLVFWDAEGNINDLGCKLYTMGRPVALNDSGQIVADIKLPGDSDFAPHYWEEDLGFIDAQDLLDDISPWTITGLTSINNQGQIIGTAQIDGEYHGVLLTPIPEPATISLILLGLVWMKRSRE